jgi:putative membrane protein
MHWDYMGGWGWGGWLASTAMMLIVFGGLAAATIWVLRRPAESRPYDADRILAERFARGEIDEDDYQRRRQLLRH